MYSKFFVKDGRNMPTSDFHLFCKLGNYTAYRVNEIAERDGWCFVPVMGLKLQDFINLAFPGEA